MKELNKNELLNISGGGIGVGTLLIIGAIVVFVIGIIDGIVRPQSCRA